MSKQMCMEILIRKELEISENYMNINYNKLAFCD